MSTISASPKDIILAWATPVSLSQLGARLFAYAETKAAITTFRLVTSHANIVLPGELIDMISSKIRDNAFESTIKGWVKVGRCLANTCTTVSHVSRADLDSLAGMVSSNWADNDEWLAGHFAQEAAEAHEKDVMNYCRLLTSLKGKSKLAKCVKIFTQDFDIHPYFTVHKTYNRHGYGIEEVHAKAYLTLPLLRAPMSSDPGPGFASFSVSSVLDPSALVALTAGQLRQFKDATNILNLHVYNPDEDETRFEDNPTRLEAPSSDGATDSGKSADGDDDGNGAESQGADSDSLKSDGTQLQVQETAVSIDADIKTVSKSPVLATEQAERNSHGDAESEEEEEEEEEEERKKETWPQLMMLGFGELEAHDLEY